MIENQLKLIKTIGTNSAQVFNAVFELDCLGVSLLSSQYHSMLAANARLVAFDRMAPHLRYRPDDAFLKVKEQDGKESRKKVWQYALRCIQEQRQKRWPTLATVMKRRKVVQCYTSLSTLDLADLADLHFRVYAPYPLFDPPRIYFGSNTDL